MKSRGMLSTTLTLNLLAAGLAGCTSYPAGTQPGNDRLNSNDPFISQARLALASYQEADASFNDSTAYAGRGFSTQILLEGSGDGGLSKEELAAASGVAAEADSDQDQDDEDENDIDLIGGLGADAQLTTQVSGTIAGLLDTQLSGLGSYSASAALFNRAATQFSARMLGAPGLSLDSRNQIQIDVNQLRSGIRADLQSDLELSNPSLDLGGQLTASANGDLRLAELSALGYSGSSSNVVSRTSAEGRTQAVLLSFRNTDADIGNRVRLISKSGLSGEIRSEHKLRLETQSSGFSRTGLRELSRDAAGQATIKTDLSMKLDNGSQIEIFEQRFVNAQGAGTGLGSFTITTLGGTSYNGALRSISSADGRLMLMLEPSDAGRGRLMMQETANGRANLILYDSAGSLAGSANLDLEAEVDALANP